MSSIDFTRLRELEAKLDEFLELKVNWDSYGGAAITHVAIRSAKAIAYAMFTYAHSSVPMAFPTSDGGVSLAWGDEDIYIDINEKGHARVWTDGVPDHE